MDLIKKSVDDAENYKFKDDCCLNEDNSWRDGPTVHITKLLGTVVASAIFWWLVCRLL